MDLRVCTQDKAVYGRLHLATKASQAPLDLPLFCQEYPQLSLRIALKLGEVSTALSSARSALLLGGATLAAPLRLSMPFSHVSPASWASRSVWDEHVASCPASLHGRNH